MQRVLLIVSAVILATPGTTGQEWIDPSPHARSFVGIEPGVALEVLDWGGSGPPMILLAGLGNTAHLFDEFARHFIDRFHVIGITRRGYGASSQPDAGYDVTTLANDIRIALDRLDIRRAVLIGHSLAGDELTKFASAFPDRVSALVYLDAAYDRTRRPTAPGPDQRVTSSDLLSVETYNAYALRTFGIRFPVNELHAMAVFDATGRMIRSVTPNAIADRILAGLELPAYKDVHTPSLAIYQPNDLRSSYPNYDHFDDVNRNRADEANKEVRAWAEHSIAQFREAVASGRVVVLSTGSHYVFITNETEVVRLVRGFLTQ